MIPKVSIIILNWNGWEDTIECLESIFQIDYPNYNVIIVDNNSNDDSINKIKEYCSGKIEIKSKYFEFNTFNKPIEVFECDRKALKNFYRKIEDLIVNRNLILIKNERNFEFACGNNIGIEFTMTNFNPDYIMLLNNDTVVKKDFLTKLLNFESYFDNIGILSPFVHYYNNPELIQHGGEIVRTIRADSERLWKKFPDRIYIKSETAAGPCMLISSKIIKEVGFLPKKCGFLLADICYSFAVRKRGYKIFSVRNSIIWHKGSVSLNKVKIRSLQFQIKEGIIFRYFFMSRKKFVARMIMNFIIYYPYFCLKSVIINKNLKGIKAVLDGIYGGITCILKKKKTNY